MNKLTFRILALTLAVSSLSSAAEPTRKPRTDIVKTENPFRAPDLRRAPIRGDHETRKPRSSKVRESAPAPRQGTTSVEHVR